MRRRTRASEGADEATAAPRDPASYEPRIVPLSVRAITPELVLGRSLDKARQGIVAGALVVLVLEDGSCQVDHSGMTTPQLSWCVEVARAEVTRQILSGEADPE